MNIPKASILIIPLLILCGTPLQSEIDQENPLLKQDPLLSVGYLEEEEEDDIAGGDRDRDRNIPMLYDKNQMRLSRQRERAMRAQGVCCPPEGPYENCVPCPKVNRNYDIENHRYRVN